MPGFRVDKALRRGAACWSAVYVGGVCVAAPGELRRDELIRLN